MNEHWSYKLKREGMTIDNSTKILINHIKNKVLSLKLVGAGGSGYVLAYTSRSNQLKKILSLIIECFSISAYPQIISFFGKEFKNEVSLITNFG